MAERAQDADHRVERGGAVHHRPVAHDGLPEPAAGLVAETAHGLDDGVETLSVAIGAVLAEAGYRRQDDAGIHLAHFLIAESHFLHGSGAEIFQDDVGDLEEAEEQFLALLVASVEGDALLAPVVGGELDAHATHEGTRVP